MKKKNMKE